MVSGAVVREQIMDYSGTSDKGHNTKKHYKKDILLGGGIIVKSLFVGPLQTMTLLLYIIHFQPL